MKRLTKRLEGITAIPVSTGADWIRDIVNRLAEYEDTGLEPEEIIELKNDVNCRMLESEFVCPTIVQLVQKEMESSERPISAKEREEMDALTQLREKYNAKRRNQDEADWEAGYL